jgi:hypothetical protein
MLGGSHLVIIEVVFLLILVGYLLNYYKSPSVTLDVTLVSYLSWTLGLAGIVLLPLDIAFTLQGEGERMFLFYLWDSIYWM